ncbi:hypothetical protein C8Q80DRAFT_1272703 [Daedaleopsis nitida]|nr:hypothetical protein C8Q80DRAFT_1272703 [Daedaleopsis nitida]
MSAQNSSLRAPFDDVDADVILRSADGVDFRLYKVVLAKASPVFQGMFTLPDSRSTDGPQVVNMTEDANTLEGLVRFCYPVRRPPFKSLDLLGSVISAATKYDMLEVRSDIIQREDTFLLKSPPVRVYLLACVWKVPRLARRAARQLLDDADALTPNPMPPEFRTLPCEVMHAFAVYRKACSTAALKFVDDDEWLMSGMHSHRISYPTKGLNPDLSSAWVWVACQFCQADYSRELRPGRKHGGTTHPSLNPRLWWSRYIVAVRRLVCDRPTGASACDPAIVKQSLQGVPKCPTCSPKANKHLKEFSEALMKRIDTAVDGIKLQLPFNVNDSVDPEGTGN